MSYTMIHTAEQIDHKLNLINENKNLLSYPYDSNAAFPASLEDVGDGSFLTTGETTVSKDIFLNDFSLPKGAKDGTTYVASLEVADVIDPLVTVTNPGFNLKILLDNVEQQSDSFSLSEIAVAQVYLTVPAGCSTKNLVIKPMIREATKDAGWVPYMGKIGNYVDERFDSTNTKIKVIADSVAAHTVNTSNPHAITLEQLGLKTETLTLVFDNGEEKDVVVVVDAI